MDIAFFRPNFKELDIMNSRTPYESPRQRVWNAIRKNREEFTISLVAEEGNMKYDSARDFITGLRKAGILKEVRRDKKPYTSSHIDIIVYKLAKDFGYTAPSVDRKGNLLTPRPVNRAMWNTLRITQQPVNAHELAALSSNDEKPVSVDTADRYLRLLHEAGYLKITQEAHHAVKKAKYKLLPHMNTGPKPPQIQRVKHVFDPNTNQVMFAERPELEEELKHGTILGEFNA